MIIGLMILVSFLLMVFVGWVIKVVVLRLGLRSFRIIGSVCFRLCFLIRFVLMRFGFIWVNGLLFLGGRRLCILVFLWVLYLLVSGFKFGIWIFGRLRMVRLLIIG